MAQAGASNEGTARGCAVPNNRMSLCKENYMTTGTVKGTVKWFNPAKGYGFIQPEDGGKDVFVHISAVEAAGLRGLNEGQTISYEVEKDRRTGKESAGQLKAAE